MDIRMPVLDGIAATRELCGGPEPGPHVLVLTTFDLDEYVYEALRAGARGFLLKDTAPDRLVAAIHAIGDDETLLAPGITRRLVERFAHAHEGAADRALLDELTEREREVLELVARGRSNQEIGEGSSSACRRSRPTSAGCCSSSGCATASRPSSSRTSRASSGPAAPIPRRLSDRFWRQTSNGLRNDPKHR